MRYLLAIIVLLTGCEPVHENRRETFAPAENDYKLAVVIDMTESFDDHMAEGGKAWDFLLDVMDTYFRDRIGSSDRIIVAQISAKKPYLIFEGTPLELRQTYDPQKFAALLRDHADPGGSPVHDAVATTMEYLMADASVAAHKAKPIIFILSDMADNYPKNAESKDRMLKDLNAFGKLNGTFGIYYCDQDYVLPWKRALTDAGIRNAKVECSIVSQPELPSFE